MTQTVERHFLPPLLSASDAYQYSGADYWIGYPNGEKGNEPLIKARMAGTAYLIAFIEDEDASYSFDELGIVFNTADSKFYVVQAAGCSCPSPTETWGIESVHETVEEALLSILNGEYQGYTYSQGELVSLMQQVEDYRRSGERWSL